MQKKRTALVVLLVIVLTVGLACNLVFETEFEYVGNSMEPTIMEGQVCTVSTQDYVSGNPKRGEVVLFVVDDNSFILRVIGLPGETIIIEGGAVYVDGMIVNEPYLKEGAVTESDTKEFNILEDFYFLMGDNRMQSFDSRDIGSIPRDTIESKVLYCEDK